MNLQNFISEALACPSDLIAYHVSRKLADLYPDKFVVEGVLGAFDLEEYVRAGNCSIIKEVSIHNQISTEWRGAGKDLSRYAENACFDVLWQGHLLDVIALTWMQDGYRARRGWIVADTREIAEAFLCAVCEWCAEVRGEILEFNDGCWHKNEELFAAIKSATFDNLILRDSLKGEIQDDLRMFFASRAMYERYGAPWKRGVLFTGAPGNGKTHTVKALINELKLPCLYVKSFKSRYEGDDDKNIQCVFTRARLTAPCLVVLEDLDALVNDKNRSYFLNELDGFAANTGVVVLATSNYPERLDAAITKRPSRFDRVYHFDLPNRDERRTYIEAWNARLEAEMRVGEACINEAVECTEGFSFAYLKELFLSSIMQWMSMMERGAMNDVLIAQATVLREQLQSGAFESAREESAIDDFQLTD